MAEWSAASSQQKGLITPKATAPATLRRKTLAHNDRIRFGDDIEQQRVTELNAVSLKAGKMTASEITNSDEVMVISPRNKLKFLCSYGGKIMARPGEQNLKYIGGETRVVAVPRDITFSEIMKKLNSLVEGGGDMILKYQVIPEELDALVTVRSDEDLKHMVEEYNRLESEGTPKLRAFLFPASPVIIENPVDPHAFDQRYLEAVNGVIRPTSSSYSGRLSPLNATFSVSTSSSPKSSSPDGRNHIDSSPLEPGILNAYHPSRRGIPKVQSSPSLYSLGTHQTQSNHQFYQPHHYYQQQLHPYSAHSPRLPQDFRMERLPGPTRKT
ncbi:Phox/Bem1p [Corchorus olitorius]|uniref:Phox/Bem1p n=1 Tax=Corchorus olitorius TaxID=93759 RepID=A0A1R3JBV2_9ROSI|nr:Phox/Bem1p [Corchorus olitorius]